MIFEGGSASSTSPQMRGVGELLAASTQVPTPAYQVVDLVLDRISASLGLATPLRWDRPLRGDPRQTHLTSG